MEIPFIKNNSIELFSLSNVSSLICHKHVQKYTYCTNVADKAFRKSETVEIRGKRAFPSVSRGIIVIQTVMILGVSFISPVWIQRQRLSRFFYRDPDSADHSRQALFVSARFSRAKGIYAKEKWIRSALKARRGPRARVSHAYSFKYGI